jgi:multidrug efflux pump subunit AcrA (membrane-fusion protein)
MACDVSAEPNGTRTHEPSLRELTADVDGVKELLISKIESLKELVNERDRLYKERDESRRTAVDAALAAAKENTASSFAASEKAIVKAENAQNDYNVRSNEFRGQLDDQAKRLIARTEVETMVKNLEEKINRIDIDTRGLRESRSESLGGHSLKDDVRSNIAVIVSIIAVVVMAAIAIFRH